MLTATTPLLSNQDVIDVALTRYGTVDGLLLLLLDNPQLFVEAEDLSLPLTVRLNQEDMTVDGQPLFDASVLLARANSLAAPIATASPYSPLPLSFFVGVWDFSAPRPILYDAGGGSFEITELLGLGVKVWGEKIVTVSDISSIFITALSDDASITGTPTFGAPGAPWDAGEIPISDASGPTYITAGVYQFECLLDLELADASTITFAYTSTFSI